MPLNFNVSPYYDDFNADKHFYRILFKPSVAVQARELTQAQSILQNQITAFADAIYKHGAMVKPGQIAFDSKARYVRLQPTVLSGGITVPVNLDLIVNQTIQGTTTGLTALVVHAESATVNDAPTLYVKYLDSGTSGTATQFLANESLTLVGSVTTIATTTSSSPCGLGASVQIGKGVYYIYGYFVQVESQYLVLNKYSNVVDARAGLAIVETLVTPQDDASLADNATGSTNYGAPGAHRYKIDLVLTSKPLTDTSGDQNFVELIRLKQSVVQSLVQKTDYSRIADELAARTADTNGDFTVRPFAIDVREHLDTSFITQDFTASAVNTSGVGYITLAQSASAVNHAYNGMTIYITDGTGAGQSANIVDYVGSSKLATLDAVWSTLKVPDTTSKYLIRDLSQVNRGIYAPAPYDIGDATKLAIGLEPGRAYVDGYQIDTLATNYVTVAKARDTGMTTSATIAAPTGNYIFIKNLFNMPLPSSSAPDDFLTIAISNTKASNGFTATTNTIGTARVHTIEWFSGVSQSDTASSIFIAYLFDVKMNAGADINSARAFYLTNNTTNNNNGNSQNAYGDIVTVFNVSNVNGTGLANAATITGPSGVGTEKIVFWDSINNLIYTEPAASGLQILTKGTFTVSGGTSGTITARTQLFAPQNGSLIYPLPQQVVSTVRGASAAKNTGYTTRRMFDATRNGSNSYVFNVNQTTGANEQFAPFNTRDYVACVVASTASSTIGSFINLANANIGIAFTANNTTLTITINSGTGGTASDTIKLQAPVLKTNVTEKTKTLITSGSNSYIAYATATPIMSLKKADIYKLVKVVDSGNPAVAADETNPAHLDITNRYNLDNGQRDFFYDVGKITLKNGAPAPTGQVKILFQYFSHSGNGDYFSVDSYLNQISYTQIPTYYSSNGEFLNLRDCLDFRPRKGDDTVTYNNFSASGASFSEALRPNDVIKADFQYYLARVDKIYVDGKGNFSVIKGTPALNPIAPNDPQNGMILYTLSLNPYTLSPSDCTPTMIKHPGYTMADIAKLEQRIENLEYYTSLNLLEQDTSNLSITDTATGLDRFKSGFLVDNFKGFSVANVFDGDFKSSMDTTAGTLRPMYTQNATDLYFDYTTSTGYVQRGTVVMLPYTDTVMAQQPYATEIERVNPFQIFTWAGSVTLIPSTDTWKDTTQRPDVIATDTSAFDNFNYSQFPSGTVWGDWQTSWVGVPKITSSNISPTQAGTAPGATFGKEVNGTRTGGILYKDANGVHEWQPGDTWDMALGVQAQIQINELVTSTQQIGQTRTGVTTSVVPQVIKTNINNSVLSISYYPYIRARRIMVIGKMFKPQTRLYPFFDGVAVNNYCQPFSDTTLTPSLRVTGGTSPWTLQSFAWGGNISTSSNQNNGTVTQTAVTPASTGSFYAGNLGDSIYSDGLGNTTLFFNIPSTDSIKFRTGTRIFTLTSDATNGDGAETEGDATYTAAGILETDQKTVTSVIGAKVVQTAVTQNKTVTNTTQFTQTRIVNGWCDPLAESFVVDSDGGAFITKVDVYFASVDAKIPVTLQIRTMVNGYPGPEILPFAEKVLYPSSAALSSFNNYTTSSGTFDVTTNATTGLRTSADASLPTTFLFDTPVYVQNGKEYCIVLLANSAAYTVYIGRMGDKVIGSNATVSQQPYAGVLFLSQNGSTWTADQTADLKFTLYRAQFNPANTASIDLRNEDVDYAVLGALPFQTASGSPVVRIYHPNHGLAKGANSDAWVKFSNVATGTYNGIPSTAFTNGGNPFQIDNVTLNTYTITVGTNATGTSRVGPDGVIATQCRQYDTLTAIVSNMVVQNTSISATVKTTSGKSVNNNVDAIQEPFAIDSSASPFTLAKSTDFLAPRMICDSINETRNLGGAKSLTVHCNMSTTSANVSPLIDISRMSVITVNSLIDDPTFANHTLTAMDIGTSMTSTSNDAFTFASSTIFTLSGVTGSTFTVGDTVTGQASGATATIVSWDSSRLTVNGVTIGTGATAFQVGETIKSGPTTVTLGSVVAINKLNTITNTATTPVLDFSPYAPGRALTITNAGGNSRTTSNPVTILSATTKVLTVDCGSTDFLALSPGAGVVLTQYNRFVSEVAPQACTGAARYITRAFTLKQAANSVRIYFTINRPLGSFVDCYYRIIAPNANAAISSALWTKIALDATVDSGVSANPSEFKEYVYTANQIGSYSIIQVKLVMRGGNSSQVPVIKNFRAVCLAT